jgi:hypothetical protein
VCGVGVKYRSGANLFAGCLSSDFPAGVRKWLFTVSRTAPPTTAVRGFQLRQSITPDRRRVVCVHSGDALRQFTATCLLSPKPVRRVPLITLSQQQQLMLLTG